MTQPTVEPGSLEPSSAASAPVAAPEILLLVTPGPVQEGPGEGSDDGPLRMQYAEVARRLSAATGVEAVVFPLGDRSQPELAALLEREPARLVAVPLALGVHDPSCAELARLLRWARPWWPRVPMLQAEPVGLPDELVSRALERAAEAIQARETPVPRDRTGALVVGAGGASAAMNAELCAVARLILEQGDLALVETAFLRDGGRPGVEQRMDQLRHWGMRRVVVLPIALLDTALGRAAGARLGRQELPGVDVVVAGALLDSRSAVAVVQERYREAVERWRHRSEDGALIPGVAQGAGPAGPGGRSEAELLPPRYRGGQVVSSAPMRSAPLRYDDQGRVAWDTVWQSFCNLALAGGPPHRGTLLEPALREEVLEDPEGYARVTAEIARALGLVTRLPVLPDASPGWVGLVCPDEEMAIWMLRAITVENVSVRREGATLFLPAGPRYRVEKEIKNVVTSVAKTHHYWTEHREDARAGG